MGISFREKLSSASKKLREAAGDVRGKAAPLREKLTSLHVKGIHKENAGAADAEAEQGTAGTKSTSGRFHMPHFPFTGRKPGEPERPASAQSAAPGAAPEEKTATQPEAGTEQKDGEITGRMKWVANPLKSGWDALSGKMPPKEKVEEKMDRAGSFLKKQAGILAANLPRREDFSEAFSRAGEKAREGFRAVSGKIRSAGAKNGEEQSGPSLRERVDELRDILYIKRKKSRPEEKDVPGTSVTSADGATQSAETGRNVEKGAATEGGRPTAEQQEAELGRLKWVANPLKYGWQAVTKKIPHGEDVSAAAQKAGQLLKEGASSVSAAAERIRENRKVAAACRTVADKAREGLRNVEGRIPLLKKFQNKKQDEQSSGPSAEDIWLLGKSEVTSSPAKDGTAAPGQTPGSDVIEADSLLITEPPSNNVSSDKAQEQTAPEPIAESVSEVTPAESAQPDEEAVSTQNAAETVAETALSESAQPEEKAASTQNSAETVAETAPSESVQPEEEAVSTQDAAETVAEAAPSESAQPEEEAAPTQDAAETVAEAAPAESAQPEEKNVSTQDAAETVAEAAPSESVQPEEEAVSTQDAAETVAEAAPSESAQPEEEAAPTQDAAETVAEAAPAESAQPEEKNVSTQDAAETVAEAAPSESVQPEEEAVSTQDAAETVAEAAPSESAQPDEEAVSTQNAAETVAETARSESAQPEEETAGGHQAAETAPEEKLESSDSGKEAAPGFFGRLKNRVSGRAKHLKPVREVVGYTAGKAGSIVKEELGAVADRLPDREAVAGAMKGAVRDARKKLSSAAEGLKKKAGDAADINFAEKAREGAGFLRGRFRSLREKIHPAEEIRKSAAAAGNRIRNAADRAEEDIREAAERIPSGETVRENVRGVLGRMGSLQEKLRRKPADPYQSGNRGVQAIGRLARGISHGAADLADMSHALGSMAANGLTNKAALPALEELLNQTFRHYGKVRSIEFRDGTLALGMKISGIREIVPVSVGTVIMSPDGRTLSFSDFASTVPAVARGLELLAVENGPVSVADRKTAAVLRSARWLGLINTQKGRK